MGEIHEFFVLALSLALGLLGRLLRVKTLPRPKSQKRVSARVSEGSGWLRLWPGSSPTDPQTPKNSKTRKSDSKVTFGAPVKVTQKLLKSDFFDRFWHFSLRAQRLKKRVQDRPPGLKFSIEIENFKRATQQTSIFVGNSEGPGLKFSSEIWNFQSGLNFFNLWGP